MNIKNVLLICLAFLSFGQLSNCTPTKIGGGGKKQPYNSKTGRYELSYISFNYYEIKLIILILFIGLLLNKVHYCTMKKHLK